MQHSTLQHKKPDNKVCPGTVVYYATRPENDLIPQPSSTAHGSTWWESTPSPVDCESNTKSLHHQSAETETKMRYLFL